MLVGKIQMLVLFSPHWAVMLPAAAQLWHCNPVQKINVTVLFTTQI